MPRWRDNVTRYSSALLAVVLVGLLLPFIVRKTEVFYTDGAGVREPVERSVERVRDILWSSPRRLALPRTAALESAAISAPRLSPAGDLLVFTVGKRGGEADLWEARREGQHWLEPRPLYGVNSEADDVGACFRPDGKAIVFASNRAGGAGGYDLWVSVLETGEWSPPRRLEGTVNTPGNELTPGLGLDGERLYFSRDGISGDGVSKEGEGGSESEPGLSDLGARDFDVYTVAIEWGEAASNPVDAPGPFVRALDVATRFGVSVTGAADLGGALSSSGDFFYFASNRPGGAGGFDLYRARISAAGPLEVRSLGAPINSAADEVEPALGASGFHLFFTSTSGTTPQAFFADSREVYLSREKGETYWSFPGLLATLRGAAMGLPPPILALLLTLVVTLLVWLVLHRRAGRAGLLLRCLVIAVAGHLLLAVWLDTSRVQRFLFPAFRPEPTFDYFEVGLDTSFEENVAASIRGATAETEGDALPDLDRVLHRSPSPSPLLKAQPLLDDAATAVLQPEPARPELTPSPRALEEFSPPSRYELEVAETLEVLEPTELAAADLPSPPPAFTDDTRPMVPPVEAPARDSLPRSRSRFDVAVEVAEPLALVEAPERAALVAPAEVTPPEAPPTEASRWSPSTESMTPKPVAARRPGWQPGEIDLAAVRPATLPAQAGPTAAPEVAVAARSSLPDPDDSITQTARPQLDDLVSPTLPDPVEVSAAAPAASPPRTAEVTRVPQATADLASPQELVRGLDPPALDVLQAPEAPGQSLVFPQAPVARRSADLAQPSRRDWDPSPSVPVATVAESELPAASVKLPERGAEPEAPGRKLARGPFPTPRTPRDSPVGPEALAERRGEPVSRFAPPTASNVPPALARIPQPDLARPEFRAAKPTALPTLVARATASSTTVPQTPLQSASGKPTRLASPPTQKSPLTPKRTAPKRTASARTASARSGAAVPSVRGATNLPGSVRGVGELTPPVRLAAPTSASRPRAKRIPATQETPELARSDTRRLRATGRKLFSNPISLPPILAQPARSGPARPQVQAPVPAFRPAAPSRAPRRPPARSPRAKSAPPNRIPAPGAVRPAALPTELAAPTQLAGPGRQRTRRLPQPSKKSAQPPPVALAPIPRRTPSAVRSATGLSPKELSVRGTSVSRSLARLPQAPARPRRTDRAATVPPRTALPSRPGARSRPVAKRLSVVAPPSTRPRPQARPRPDPRGARSRRPLPTVAASKTVPGPKLDVGGLRRGAATSTSRGLLPSVLDVLPASRATGVPVLATAVVPPKRVVRSFFFEPMSAPEPRSGAIVALEDVGSNFIPRIYQLREVRNREAALKRGGGSALTESAVERGLAWLSLHQARDGRWSLRNYASELPSPSRRDLRHPDWEGRYWYDSRGGSGRARSGDTAATGLALLCFLGHGETHTKDGPYQQNVAAGLRWLLQAQKPDGDLRGDGNLYMHGVASFALCEAYAFTSDPELREPAQRAIDFTARSQNPERGGWRYLPYPESNEVDTSVFGWMLMALKSAELGGLRVDPICLRRSAFYLNSARRTATGGEYNYQPKMARTSLAMTAQGFFSQLVLTRVLQEVGDPETKLSLANRESTDVLLSHLPRASDQGGVNFYYWYYASLALFQQGGESWEVWNNSMSKLIVLLQLGDEHGTAAGSWDPRDHRAAFGGRVYSTAMSILILEVYYRYAQISGEW